MWEYQQWEFNQLMNNYRRQFRSQRCKHSPKEMLLYRLSLVFNLGMIVGFIVKSF